MFAVNRLIGRVLAVVVAGAVVGACGSDDDYANEPRPPTPINVAAAITDDEISVSPESFGAGPIVLIVSNQSEAAQRVTFETESSPGSEPGIKQTTGPINPRGTATLKVNVAEGSYQLSVDDAGIDAATFEVGAMRESAQNELLQP